VYIGCETHSVPSWSKVATRASGGTNFGLVLSVVACTNATIACFAGPSFHDGKGSGWACTRATIKKMAAAASHARVHRVGLLSVLPRANLLIEISPPRSTRRFTA
jgi:hypothetical protein